MSIAQLWTLVVVACVVYAAWALIADFRAFDPNEELMAEEWGDDR